MATLYYYHDPMCSWCWGYRPALQKLFSSLPEGVTRTNIVGGLAPDSDQPMPEAQREAIASYWRRIADMLGAEFNHDFWTKCEPRRSTYPACRAVIAAAKQGREEEMIFEIQKAYYLEARNPSDIDTLEILAEQLGLDTETFRKDIASSETEAELQRQISFARASGVSGFPSLALEVNGQLLPISVDYKNYEASLKQIQQLIEDTHPY
jgi:putative protein-disulfide isomerase